MSGVAVNPGTVVAVLLADGWHRIARDSFSVGPLAFGTGSDLGALGFRFEEADIGSPYRPAILIGPVDSILAVRQVGSAASDPGELARATSRRWACPAPEAVA
jgi:hypothetical protein